MKKVLLSVFFAMVSLNYAKQTQTMQDLPPHQRENIDFSIKEIPYEKWAQKVNQEPPIAHQITQQTGNYAPALAPEISAKQWKSLGEEKEAQEKRLQEEQKLKEEQKLQEEQKSKEEQGLQEEKNKPENTPKEEQKTQEKDEGKNQLSEPKDDVEKQDKTQEDVSIAPAKATSRPDETQKPAKPERKINKKPSNKDDDSLEESSPNSKKITFSQEEFYSPKKNEISISKNSQKLFLQIHSEELQKFMEGVVYNTKQQVQTFALKDSYTQITNVDGKIQEYKYAQKSIDRYSAIAPHQKYPLKKISKTQYQILIKKIPPFFDIKGCKVVVKKELTGTLNQTKEIIINLDTKRELRNNPHFDLFLECPQ